MKKKILMFLSLILSFALFGCIGCSENCTIGDGQVDEVESAVIKVAVGAALTAMPETVAPAYAVSTGLLTLLDGSEATTLGEIDAALSEKLDELKITESEKQSVLDLVGLVKAKIVMETEKTGIAENEKIVVVKTIVGIVQSTSASRLEASD